MRPGVPASRPCLPRPSSPSGCSTSASCCSCCCYWAPPSGTITTSGRRVDAIPSWPLASSTHASSSRDKAWIFELPLTVRSSRCSATGPRVKAVCSRFARTARPVTPCWAELPLTGGGTVARRSQCGNAANAIHWTDATKPRDLMQMTSLALTLHHVAAMVSTAQTIDAYMCEISRVTR